MLQEVFADTGYFLALHLGRDELHKRAIEVGQEVSSTSRIVTSDLIEIETLNALSGENGTIKDFAVWYFEEMRKDSEHLVVPCGRELLQRAEEHYR